MASAAERRAFGLGLLVRAGRADVAAVRSFVGIVVEPKRGDSVDSPMWEVVARMGEGNAFAIVHAASDADLRAALDQLLAQPWMSAPAE
jgi:hypothetical protein